MYWKPDQILYTCYTLKKKFTESDRQTSTYTDTAVYEAADAAFFSITACIRR